MKAAGRRGRDAAKGGGPGKPKWGMK